MRVGLYVSTARAKMLAGMHPDLISEITESQERPAKVKVSTVGENIQTSAGHVGESAADLMTCLTPDHQLGCVSGHTVVLSHSFKGLQMIKVADQLLTL